MNDREIVAQTDVIDGKPHGFRSDRQSISNRSNCASTPAGRQPNTTRQLSFATLIVVQFLGLTSSVGCQLLRIPSYRSHSMEQQSCSESCESDCSSGINESDEACATGILPPLAPWFAHFHQQKEKLPEPPAYPRFHPVPTRPMFEPRPTENSFAAISWGPMVPGQGYPDAYSAIGVSNELGTNVVKPLEMHNSGAAGGQPHGGYGAMPTPEQWNQSRSSSMSPAVMPIMPAETLPPPAAR